jgi:poly(A) polymerase
MTHLVVTVSPERIAAELRAMVSRTGRRRALDLLDDIGLAREVLIEVAPGPGTTTDREAWRQAARTVDALDEPDLPRALCLLAEDSPAGAVPRLAARLRLSNHETKAAGWLRDAVHALGCESAAGLRGRPWSAVQPWLAHDHAFALADVFRARAACGRGDADAAAWVTAQAARPRNELDPPPLVTGNDLLAAGVPPGKPVGAALARIRALQLDGAIETKDEALAIARP